MRKIILTTSLFFCLAITTVLAQITPDGTTATSTSDVSGVTVIGIATPDSNGLSNNTYSDFNISSSGIILNNSGSSSLSELTGGSVSGNSNITGSPASLILNQVTSINASSLLGTAEVVGSEAGIIIANPKGITCDGCAFINANRVDLVTGSNYNALTDRFGSISGKNITVSSDLAVAVLNIQTKADFINQSSSTIVADTVTIEVINFANNINNNGTVSSDSLNLIVIGQFDNNSSSLNGFSFNNLAVTTDSSFSNNVALDLNNLTIKTEANFTTSSRITANSFNITAKVFTSSGLITANSGTITSVLDSRIQSGINSDSLTVMAGRDFKNTSTINVDNLNVTAGDDFDNDGTINADTVTIEVTNFNNDIENSGTVSSDSLNIILTNNFAHNSDSFTGFNNFSNLTITTTASLTNNATIDLAGNLGITANSFTNNATIDLAGNLGITANSFTNTGGVVSADTFALSLAGDFDYSSDFLNNGTITADNLNFTARNGIFTNDTTIELAAGSLGITANDFMNSGSVTANTFTLSVDGSFDNDGGVVSADTFSLSVAGDFDYIADYLADLGNGTITINTLNLTVGGNFTNDDSANNFIWRTSDSLTVLGEASIDAAGFENSGTINVTNSSLNLTATDLTNTGTISANSFDITATDFTNSGTISANTTLNTTVSSTASNSFSNVGVVSADTFSLSVAGDFDYNDKGKLTTNAFNITVDGNFSNNNSANDFIWDAQNTLTVLGNADITANNYTQNGAIDVTGVLTINVESDFDYVADFNGTINFNSINLNVGGNFSNDSANNFIWDAQNTLTVLGTADIVAANFENSGTINVTNSSLNLTATDLTNTGTISANSFDITATDITNSGTINVTNSSLNLTATDLTNTGTISANSFDITATDFTNSGTISANTTLNTTVASTVSGSFNNTGGVVSADTFNLTVASAFDYIADYLNNGTITTNTFNLTLGGSFSNRDASDDFVLATNDSLSILGDFTIATNNYIQFGTLEVLGDLAIDTENNFANSGNITVTGALAIDTENNFTNSGSITTDSLEITAGYIAINQGSIVSANLDLTADDFFRNLTGGDIAVASLNITAGGKVTNTANINVEGTLNITANNDSTRDNDPTGFYVSNRGNITATTLNIEAVDNFYNRGNITATNFTTSAKSVFFLNKEIDSYDGTYDGGNIFLDGDSSFIADGGSIQNYGNIISLNGDSAFIADGGSIQNYGNIDLGIFNLDLTADSFTNHADATIDADTLNLINVNRFIDNGSIDATIDQ